MPRDNTHIVIAVPTYGAQEPEWWSALMSRIQYWSELYRIQIIFTKAANPDTRKNIAAGEFYNLTERARNQLVEEAIEQQGADYIFFVDHDTVPPYSALPALLSHKYTFVAGIYHHRNEPHAPLLYERVKDGPTKGEYHPIVDYHPGAVIHGEGIATGMGCALIHRSVFEDIYDQYNYVFVHDGGQTLVHNESTIKARLPKNLRTNATLLVESNGEHYLVQRVRPATAADESRYLYPFYEMNQGRTEDFGFCERAEKVGHPVRVDLAIVCEHWQKIAITDKHHSKMRHQMKRTGELPNIVGGKTA